ncbi:S8 family serine peptidase [Actinoplanes sp. CA-051413]|uniref:S8 family serine peptidase n=1 Tax=Actinoplanes sp. CA-051413 TaxID=3239899 RepID=UPI003D95538F
MSNRSRRPGTKAAATAAAALTALSSALGALPAAAADPAAPGTSSIIVGVRPGASTTAVVGQLDARPGIEVLESDPIGRLAAADVTVPAADVSAALQQLRSNPSVAYAEPNHQVRITDVTPNDPAFVDQWGATRTAQPAAWSRSTGSGITVAVVDSGVSPISELAGRLLPGYDFVNDDSDATDVNGHGTQAASVIAAKGNNATGIAGVCWDCKILPVRVLDGNGSGYSDDVAAGITYAADRGAQVINLSLGGPDYSQLTENAVNYAVAKGAVVIASAGNSGVSARSYPAGHPNAIAVAGSTSADGRYSWSNYGTVADPWVDVAAPGRNIAQGMNGGLYWFEGTSSAGPVVAGIAALARAAAPAATVAQIRAAIESGADPVGTWVAKGRVNAGATLAALTGTPATPNPVPNPPATPAGPVITGLGLTAGQLVRGIVTFSPSITSATALAKVQLRTQTGTKEATTNLPLTGTRQVSWKTTGFTGPATLTLTVTDTAGRTATAQVQVTVDNTAPAATVTSPAAGATVTRTVPVTISTTATDVVKVELLVKNAVVATATTAPWALSWDSAGANAGVSLTVRVTDVAGNVTTVTRAVVADNAGPVLSWRTPAADAVVGGTLKVETSATDVSGVTKVELLRGDTVLATDTTAPYSFAWNTAGAAGRTALVLRATDKLGYVSTAARTVVVDNKAPVVTSVSPAAAASVTGTLATSLTATDEEGVAAIDLLVNGKRTTGVRGRTTLLFSFPAGRLTGSPTLTWTVTDKAGNVTTVTRTVSIAKAAGQK